MLPTRILFSAGALRLLYRIKLTPAGRRAHRTAAALFAPMRDSIVEKLGTEEAAVHAALVTLRTALDAVRNTPADDQG